MLSMMHRTILLEVAPSMAGDVFTSFHDMETLANLENQLLNTLRNYISTQEARLSHITKKLEQLTKVRPESLAMEGLITDPINAFSLVRRLTREWPLILNLMVGSYELPEGLEARLPSNEEMQSAVRGLARLQDVYNLDTEYLARERPVDQWGYSCLTALDCFEIGKYWYSKFKFKLAKSWFEEALKKTSNEDLTVRQEQVLEHLYPANVFSNCGENGLAGKSGNVLHYLMSEYPDYKLSAEVAQHFRDALAGNCSLTFYDDPSQELRAEEAQAYSEICRGPGSTPPGLRCYYVHYNNPKLLIAPFKLEELHLDPPLVMFHRVISDQEIQVMQTALAKNKQKCKVTADDDDNEDEEFSKYYRTCDVSWVLDKASITSAILSARVGDMTNLAMGSSEYNQVASYGLGGEFLLHYDPLNEPLSAENQVGDRVATLMFYLNDVESGGFTVFSRLNLSVTPQKGSAVFWFNLDAYGEELPDMFHGGCPVLKGFKMVINKWIREGGQDYQLVCPADGIFPKPRFYLNNDE